MYYSCSVSSMTVGTCLPGRYTLRYSVQGPTTGLTSSAFLQIYIEIRTSYSLSFQFKPNGLDLANLSAVRAFASDLATNSTLSTSLAVSTAPLFGINATSVRQVGVNSTNPVPHTLPNGTLVYIISINMTVTAGETPIVALPAALQDALAAQNASKSGSSRRRLVSLLEGPTSSRSRLRTDRALAAALSHYELAQDQARESLGLTFESLGALKAPMEARRSLLSSQSCLGTSNLTVPNASSSNVVSASLPTPSCTSSYVSVDSVTQAYLVGAFADTSSSLVTLQGLFQSMQDMVSHTLTFNLMIIQRADHVDCLFSPHIFSLLIDLAAQR